MALLLIVVIKTVQLAKQGVTFIERKSLETQYICHHYILPLLVLTAMFIGQWIIFDFT